MDHATHNKIVSFIWLIADDCLRDGFVRGKYRDVILPHVLDAWIDESKTVIGYEISFNKYFYVHQPLRDLDEVVREIRELEKETEGLLESILDFTN